MLNTSIIVVLVVVSIWLCILTYLLFRLSSHYNRLTSGANKKSLTLILEDILSQMQASQKDIANLVKWCDTIEKDGRVHIQKIGLIRFNPFKDTGGNQSFILSLLDGENSGVVLSGLYSRSGTRWYAKRIEKGNGVEHELSDEEKKAIKESKRATI